MSCVLVVTKNGTKTIVRRVEDGVIKGRWAVDKCVYCGAEFENEDMELLICGEVFKKDRGE